MKKVLLFVILLLFLYGCANKNTILDYNDKLVFKDSRGYYLYLYFENDNLINAEWRIITSSLDDAHKITKAFEKDDNYSIKLSGTMVILKYSDDYRNQMFENITKSDIENYLIDNDYEVIEEE